MGRWSRCLIPLESHSRGRRAQGVGVDFLYLYVLVDAFSYIGAQSVQRRPPLWLVEALVSLEAGAFSCVVGGLVEGVAGWFQCRLLPIPLLTL